MANSTLNLLNKSVLTVDDPAYLYKREIPIDLLKISPLENFRPPVMINFSFSEFSSKTFSPRGFYEAMLGVDTPSTIT